LLCCAIGRICGGRGAGFVASRRFSFDARVWLANQLVGFTATATFLIAFAVYEITFFAVWATLLGGTEI
jgi:hypothetical protein